MTPWHWGDGVEFCPPFETFFYCFIERGFNDRGSRTQASGYWHGKAVTEIPQTRGCVSVIKTIKIRKPLPNVPYLYKEEKSGWTSKEMKAPMPSDSTADSLSEITAAVAAEWLPSLLGPCPLFSCLDSVPLALKSSLCGLMVSNYLQKGSDGGQTAAGWFMDGPLVGDIIDLLVIVAVWSSHPAVSPFLGSFTNNLSSLRIHNS